MRYQNNSAIDIIDEALQGRIAIRHAQMALEACSIFGAFRDGEFHGHDFLHGQQIDRSRRMNRGRVITTTIEPIRLSDVKAG